MQARGYPTRVAETGLPTFDLVVATVGRVAELGALLDSLAAQTHHGLRVVVADQNDDDRLGPVLAAHDSLSLLRIRPRRGLSCARNAALRHLEAEIVAFPDDDCAYPVDLLERVGRRFAADGGLDGLSGRIADRDGRSPARLGTTARRLDRANVWHGGVSAGLFFRRSLVERVGGFDERLGLGAGTPWESGEEIDLLIRAFDAGANVEYDPSIAVHHELSRPDAQGLRRLGRRDGGSVGFVLRKHRYPARTVARMMTRPVGGAMISLARRDPALARFHLATLRGRVAGYVAGGREA